MIKVNDTYKLHKKWSGGFHELYCIEHNCPVLKTVGYIYGYDSFTYEPRFICAAHRLEETDEIVKKAKFIAEGLDKWSGLI